MPHNGKRNKKARKQLQSNLQRAKHLLEVKGAPEDPSIAAIITKASLAKTNKEALEASLLLEKIIMGDSSMLNDRTRSDELNWARAEANARDKAEEAFERNQEGFINDVINRSESVKLSGDGADRTRAIAVKMHDEALNNQKARNISKQLELDWQISNGPKRDVNATGVWLNVGSADRAQPVLQPEEIKIMHRTWILQPGLNRNVPAIFADRYEDMLRSRAENEAREKVLGKSSGRDGVSGLEYGALERRMQEIDRLFGSKRQSLEV